MSTVAPLAVNQVHQGDCVERLNQIRPGTVDLVFADPPFNIGYDYDIYDDRQSREHYLAFCRRWIEAVHRVTKADGSFWLAIGDEYAAELKLLAQEGGFHCRSWVIWYYTFGVNCVRGFSRSHTHLFYFVKDPERFTFNGDNPTVRVPSARQLVYADARANPKGRLPDNTWILRPQDASPVGFCPSHDTWYFARVAGTFKEREGFHGCQMPEQLLGRIIRVSSDPGDLVLDPFTGSGTTLVVAKKLGRQFLGIELSEDYVARVDQRLEGCTVGDPLDGPADPVRSAPPTVRGKQRVEFRGNRPVIELSGEIRREVQAAFEEAGRLPTRVSGDDERPEDKPRYVSAEGVLLDPERNERFVQHCKDAKLLGDARTWNEFLLRMSREGLLADEGKRRRGTLSSIGPVIEAVEIAFQMLSVDYGMDLEAILCSPAAAAEFDQAARLFGDPEMVAEVARNAIWDLHRIATAARITRAVKRRAAAHAEQPQPDRETVQALAERLEGQPAAGVYAFWDPASVLYVGQTDDLGAALNRLQTRPGWQRFQVDQVQFWPVDDPTEALVLRCLLVTQSKPWLNAHFLHQPVAISLF